MLSDGLWLGERDQMGKGVRWKDGSDDPCERRMNCFRSADSADEDIKGSNPLKKKILTIR